jgi:hypothetical protein
MRRFSIRSLSAFVLVSAIGLAALKNDNEVWAGMLLLLALATLGTAVLGSVFLRGKERAWWIGFAFFGGVYLALAVGPWFSETIEPQLGTRLLLNYVQAKLLSLRPDTINGEHVTYTQIQGILLKTPSGSTVHLLAPFHRVGHCLFTLLAGLLGGMIAVWFYMRRETGGRDADPHK